MRGRYPLAAIAALGIALLAPQVRASCFFDSTLFAPASPLLSGVGALEGAAVADLNGDGIPDIAFAPGGVTSSRFLLANTTAGSAWYKVVAVDVHGNESAASAVFASRTTDTDNASPTRLAITASPNPGPGRTVFTLSLPRAVHVRVKVLDAGGAPDRGLDR